MNLKIELQNTEAQMKVELGEAPNLQLETVIIPAQEQLEPTAEPQS